MGIHVTHCRPDDIDDLRRLFLHEFNAQFIHDKCHLYGWSDDYQVTIDNTMVGYASVWGIDRRQDRDTIFEFFMLPAFRKYKGQAVRELIGLSGVQMMECQTNDPNTSAVFFEHAMGIEAQSILFEDSVTTSRPMNGLRLLDESNPDDRHREWKYALMLNSERVASGGLLLNYNFPYADVYVDVNEAHRGKGYGALLVQEVKRMAYAIGRIPAARCRVTNLVSKAMLMNAGFRVCGYWLVGKVHTGRTQG